MEEQKDSGGAPRKISKKEKSAMREVEQARVHLVSSDLGLASNQDQIQIQECMITNTRQNVNEESKNGPKNEKDNGVTPFAANQKVHNVHVVLDANLPDLDQPKVSGPNIINTQDLGIPVAGAPHIGADIWDGQIKPKFNQNGKKKKKKKINSKKQSELNLKRLVSDFDQTEDFVKKDNDGQRTANNQTQITQFEEIKTTTMQDRDNENVGFDIYNPEFQKHVVSHPTQGSDYDRFATNFKSPDDTVLSPKSNRKTHYQKSVQDNIAMMENHRAMTQVKSSKQKLRKIVNKENQSEAADYGKSMQRRDSKMSGPLPKINQLHVKSSHDQDKQIKIPDIDENKSSQRGNYVSQKAKLTVKLRTEKQHDKKVVASKIQEEMTMGLTQFPDLEMKPTKVVSQKEYMKKTKRQKKLYNVQSQIFGRDVLESHIKNYLKLNKKYGNDDDEAQDQYRMSIFKSLHDQLMHEEMDEDIDHDMDTFQVYEADNLEGQESSGNRKNQAPNVFDFLLIKKDCTWKGAFDLLMLFVSCYNIFGNALYSAFGMSDEMYFWYLDNFVETLFLMDMVFCFCQEYLDEETYTVQSDIKTIAKHYLKRSFIFDLLAWLPIDQVILLIIGSANSSEYEEARLFRLLKLLRLPRLKELLDVEKFKQIVNEYYTKKLEYNIRNENYGDLYAYPILKALLIVQFYRVLQLVIIIFACSFFLGIFWHIYIKDIESSYPLLQDVYHGSETFYRYEDYRFISQPHSFSSLMKVWYYAFTTLSTIGFGDFAPKSIQEKFIISFVLMLGVSVFSYIMGNFIEIVLGYKSLERQGENRELTKWISLLTKYNQSVPLSKELITRLEDFFQFFWFNNPLLAIKSETDMRFLQELPENTVQKLYIEYLFKNFMYNFRTFMKIKFKGRIMRITETKYRVFLVKFLSCLEPRQYLESDGLIQDQFNEVFEVLYVMKGGLVVGYRLFNDIFWAKYLKEEQAMIGDFACLHNKVSEFLYKPHDIITGFAIKKQKFMQIIDDRVGANLRKKICRNYINNIRNPTIQHREIEARKFQSRIDYVDLSAFGVGVKFDDIDHFKKGVAEIERKISMFSSRYGCLIQNLKGLDNNMTNLMHRLCALAQRYDERMQMITKIGGNEDDFYAIDNYQIQVLEKTYNKQAFEEKLKQPVKRVTIMKIQNGSETNGGPLMNMQKGEPMTPGTAINFATSVFKQIKDDEVNIRETESQIKHRKYARERLQSMKHKEGHLNKLARMKHKDSFVEVLKDVYPK